MQTPSRPTRPRLSKALAVACAAALVPAVTGATDAPVFGLPVACDMERVCSIQKYVDHDPGPEREDYECGRLSLDGDTGTDFRVPDIPTMKQGVIVVAAADGVVKAVRDGMADISVRTIGRGMLEGRDAGNGVVIDHGGGWETQYSHLRKNSVAVKPGQRVTAGDRLGLIGLSGNTEFPHVEFAVRHRGEPVDPFVGPRDDWRCGDERSPMWSAAASALLTYRPTVPLIAGFATDRPDTEAARDGRYDAERLAATAPALVLWVDVSGVHADDVERFRILGPDGTVLHDRQRVLGTEYISWFAFSGLRRPASGWPPGRYRGIYTLTRAGAPVAQIEAAVSIGAPG